MWDSWKKEVHINILGGGRGLLEPLHRDERIPVAISGWLRGLLRLADSRFSGASGCAPATGAALLKPTRPSPRFNHGNQTLRGLHGNTAVSSSLICIIERVHREDEWFLRPKNANSMAAIVLDCWFRIKWNAIYGRLICITASGWFPLAWINTRHASYFHWI